MSKFYFEFNMKKSLGIKFSRSKQSDLCRKIYEDLYTKPICQSFDSKINIMTISEIHLDIKYYC